MRVKPRGRDSHKTKKPGQPNFRSKLEKTVSEQLIRAKVTHEYESEVCKIGYTIPSSDHLYLCDFVISSRSGNPIYIEVKGIWDYEDRYKHYLLRKQHPTKDIRFVFQRASNKIRKGSKTTYMDICNGSGKGIFKGVQWKFGDKGKVPKDWYLE